MIELYVYNGNIQIKRFETLTSGRVGHKIHISFNQQWQDLPYKDVTFTAGNLSVTETIEEESVIYIPVKVLRKPNYDLYISLKGYNDDLSIIIPTKEIRLGVIHQGNEIFSSESERIIEENEMSKLDIATYEEVEEMLDDVLNNQEENNVVTEEEVEEMLNNIFEE